MVEEQGWKGRIVSIGHLADLREAILGRFEQGLIDERLYREQLGFFSFDPPADFPGACSIIIVAAPTPQMRIAFHWQGIRVSVVVPPTYVSYTPRTESVQAALAARLQHDGFRLTKPKLPLKTLAARSGLVNYGRNNICYAPGMGSFFQLVGAFSDIPCDDDPWRDPALLPRCKSCVACLRSCPTGAIVKDRFLLHAERCLTYHNEAAAEFPTWIDPSWHHCLVGCLRCQTTCPENNAVRDWFEDRAEFSEDETGLIIAQAPIDRLPPEMVTKWQRLEINEDYGLLCRNLKMIICNQQRGTASPPQPS